MFTDPNHEKDHRGDDQNGRASAVALYYTCNHPHGSSSTARAGPSSSASPLSTAHRAATEASTEASRLAAQAAGDAASAAYLHPIAKAHQAGHILRAAANAARITEMKAGGDPAVGDRVIEKARGPRQPCSVFSVGIPSLLLARAAPRISRPPWTPPCAQLTDRSVSYADWR